MAKVLPTLREKKRYLVFEVIGDATCAEALGAVKSCFTSLFGVLEAGKANIKSLKAAGKLCMVSVNRAYVDKAKASLIMVKNIKSSAVILRSVGVSGSVKGATTKYLSMRGAM